MRTKPVDDKLHIPDFAYSWAYVQFLKARHETWREFVELFLVASDKTVSAEQLRQIKKKFDRSFHALDSTEEWASGPIDFVADAGAVSAEIFRTDFMAALEEYLRNSGDVE